MQTISGAAAFRGTSHDQDSRFPDKEKKLLKTTKFPPEFSVKVDFNKVSLEVFRPWIARRVTALLGIEDDVVVGLVFNMVEELKQDPDPRKLQIRLMGFLESKTKVFVEELWKLCISAQDSVGGIPKEFLEEKRQELEKASSAQKKVVEKLQSEQETIKRERSRSRSRDRAEETRRRRYSKERERRTRRRNSRSRSRSARRRSYDEGRRRRRRSYSRSPRRRRRSRDRSAERSRRRHRSDSSS